jgi:uncharacterized membrane protein YedE/YeeE
VAELTGLFGFDWLVVFFTAFGVVLIVLGLIQSGVVLGRIGIADRLFQEPLARRQARLRRDRPVLDYGLFGFGYVLAGFG